jgi:hypothetical protein
MSEMSDTAAATLLALWAKTKAETALLVFKLNAFSSARFHLKMVGGGYKARFEIPARSEG